MKKLLFALFLGFCTQISGQQVGAFQIYVVNQSGSPLSNVPVTVTDYSGGSSTTITSLTNANGMASDSLGIGSTGFMSASAGTALCFDTTSIAYTLNNGPWVWFVDTLVICGTPTVQNKIQISAIVYNMQGNGVAYQPVVVTDSALTPQLPTVTYSFVTDASGALVDSITTAGSNGYIIFRTTDSCNVTQKVTLSYNSSTTGVGQAGFIICNSSAQGTKQISALVLTNNYQNNVPNHPVTVIDSSTSGNFNVAVYNYSTDTNGTFSDVIVTQGTTGTLYFIAPDSCGFATMQLSYGQNTPFIMATAGIVLCNNIVSSPCSYSISAQQTGSGYIFGSTFPSNPSNTYVWNFGDGNTSTLPNPSHTYSQPGTYVYCLQVNNCPTVCDTLVITSFPTSCSASFIIDSVNSQPGNVIVWNTSAPAYTPNNTTQYLWDFGDGSTSTQAFPSHTYNGAGTYIICLGITVPATPTMPACSSIYCDTLKVDSLGNIIQKSTGANFTLNVLDPNTISIDERDFSTSKIFPNPASEFIQIEIDANSTGNLNIELISLNGSLINSISNDVNSGLTTLEMDVRDVVSGIYFIKISKDGTNHFEKVIIR